MNFELARFNMVEQQIRPWDVFDKNVLTLLSKFKREDFISPEYANLAYSDIEIPLPCGQKMLSPKVEARLIQALDLHKKDKVLEIGTGSGYVTALLAKLADFVYSIEINPTNKQFAVENLTKAGIKNASIIEANGINGLPSKAPFNKILVAGSIDKVDEQLSKQLKMGGILVAIIGEEPTMHATVIKRISDNEYSQTVLFETCAERLINEQDNKHNNFNFYKF